MSPKKRYLTVILFWVVSILVLFAIRKIFFPEKIEGHALLIFQISAAGVCVLVGLIRILDTIYNCAHGIVICVYPTHPMETIHYKVSPLLFISSLMFEIFIWSMLIAMMWPWLHDAIIKLR
jgi:hypothetical protein